MIRLIAKSRWQSPHADDSLKEKKQADSRHGDIGYGRRLLTRAENAWSAQSKLRNRRQRNINYCYGDQWSDLVRDEKGNMVPERERVAKRTGGVALQNNHLIKIIHSLEGLYSKQASQPVCFSTQPNSDDKSDMMTNALQTNWNNNRMHDMLISWMGEMLIGGMPVALPQWTCINGVEDVYTFTIEPSHFFFESSGIDPLHRDVELIGHFEDFTRSALLARLARSKHDAQKIDQIYQTCNDVDWQYGWTYETTEKLKRPEWNNPETGMLRVYHVWSKEHKMRYRVRDIMDFDNPLYRIDVEDLPIVEKENAIRLDNAMRAGMPLDEVPLIEYEEIFDTYWHYTMLAPDGTILEEYDNPYEHNDHPYVFKAHEYVNGDIVPYVSSIIDQQRYINRLVTLFDLVIQASAKGVTLIPKSIVPKNMTEAEFARSCRELGNYIFYDDHGGKVTNKPDIIQSNTNMTGITEMLSLQLGFIPDISGVSESLQGKSPGANVAASRYAMETQNSTTSVSGLLEKFGDFERELARKMMKMIHQFYSEPRNISMKRTGGYAQYVTYDPIAVQDIDFQINIEMSPKSPVFRMAINDLVAQMWQAGAIDAQTMLQMQYLPGGSDVVKKLTEATQKMQEQAMAMQAQAQQAAPSAEAIDQAEQPASPTVNPMAMREGHPYVRGENIDVNTVG